MLKSHDNGAWAESLFMAVAHAHGWEIAKPLVPAYPYDFIVKRKRKWESIQVKLAYARSGDNQIRVSVRKSGSHQYGEDDFDFLFAVLDSNRMWLIPHEKVIHYRSAFDVTQPEFYNFMINMERKQ